MNYDDLKRNLDNAPDPNWLTDPEFSDPFISKLTGYDDDIASCDDNARAMQTMRERTAYEIATLDRWLRNFRIVP